MTKKVLLISESSVYTDEKGDFIARGGGAACFHNIGKGLSDLGYDVSLYSLREFDVQKEQEVIDGVKYERKIVSSRSSLKLIAYLFESWKRARDYDYIFVNQFLPHLILMFLPKKFKVAVVHDVYTGTEGNFWVRQFGFFVGNFGRVVERLQLYFDKWFADKIMTVSKSSEEKIVSVLGKSVKGKIFINANSINFNDYKVDLEKDDYLLFVGRFVSYKHPEHLLYVINEVRKKFPEFKVVFVNTRDFVDVHKKFDEVKASLGLDDAAVEVKDFCGDDELKDLFSRAKVLVHPSHMEGQGIVILEALASGTPVAAYDLLAYNEMLDEGKNCELAEMGDVLGLSDACIQILSNYEYYKAQTCSTLGYFDFSAFRSRLEVMLDLSSQSEVVDDGLVM